MSLVAPARADFPVLAQEGLTYLDSAATAQTARPVIEAMDEYYTEYRASIHRGVYPLAARATDAYEGARDRVASFAGSTAGETVFTRNATEAINLVAYAWGRANVRAGDVIVVTQMEHHSNLVPWQILCTEVGAELAYVPVTDDGLLDLDALDLLLARSPRLLAVAHVSNVLGTVNPIADIAERAHAAGTIVMVDGAQAVPHLPVDVAGLGADFYAWTGHKAYGPTGVGVLHGRRDLLEAMPPFLGGGHMISRVGDLESSWAEPPARFEAGTMPVAEAIGLGAAVDYLTALGMENVEAHEKAITGYALEKLAEIPGVTVIGPPDTVARGGAVSFTVEDIHPHDVGQVLDDLGIAVRVGHHCAWPVVRRYGVPATTRATFYVHTGYDDIDALADGIRKAQQFFGVAPREVS